MSIFENGRYVLEMKAFRPLRRIMLSCTWGAIKAGAPVPTGRARTEQAGGACDEIEMKNILRGACHPEICAPKATLWHHALTNFDGTSTEIREREWQWSPQ